MSIYHRFEVIPDPGGGYIIRFPDLSGCLTQIEDLSELPAMAQEIYDLWLETEQEYGQPIPAPAREAT